jgi:hypothetical protein
MKERNILFSAAMVRPTLAGTKTQTRRVVKPQPPTPEEFPGAVFGLSRCVADEVKMYNVNDHDRLPKHPTDWDLVGSVGRARAAGRSMRYRCPYGQPGDRLVGRETWQYADWTEDGMPWIRYRADGATRLIEDTPEDWSERLTNVWASLSDPANYAIDNRAADRRWRPAIHMPRWASRILLEIVSVRVDRLQDISEADAWAEGCERGEPWDNGQGFFPALRDLGGGTYDGWDDAREWYADLWESINGPGSWDANPWVWVVEFKRIDAQQAAP